MTATAQPLDRRDRIDAVAVVFMLLLTMSWCMNGVTTKLATMGYNLIFLNVAHLGIGCVLVFLWFLYRCIPLFRRNGTLRARVAAELLFGAGFSLFSSALNRRR